MTSAPSEASFQASVLPAGPPPTMMTSYTVSAFEERLDDAGIAADCLDRGLVDGFMLGARKKSGIANERKQALRMSGVLQCFSLRFGGYPVKIVLGVR